MVREILPSAAIVGQMMVGVASAAPARPKAVRVVSHKPVAAIGTSVRIASRSEDGNDLAGMSMPMVIVGGIVAVATFAVIVGASGAGDIDSSAN